MPPTEPPTAGTHTKGKSWRPGEFTDIKYGDSRPLHAVLAVALSSTLVLSALVLTPGLLFHYDVTPKIVVVLLGSSVAVACGPQWIPGLRELCSQAAGRVLLASMALQAASACLSTVLSVDEELSFIGSSWRRLGLMEELSLVVLAAAVAGFAAGSQRRIFILLRSISLAGAAGALYGISQYFGFDPFLAARSYQIGDGEWMIVRTPGTLGHAGYFAVFLTHGCFAGAALARLDPSPTWRREGTLTAALAAAAILFSGTRSAIVGLAGGAAFLLIWFRPRLRAPNLTAALLLALACWGFYISPAGEQMRARTRWYVEDPAGGGRLLLWRDSAKMGAARWLSGWGLESFSSAFLPYQSVELAQAFPDRYYESAHNIFLDAWTSQGLPGLLSLTGLLLAGGVTLRGARAHGSRLSGLLCAGLLAAALAGQFLAFTAVTKLYFYAQAALQVALAATSDSRRGPAPSRWPLRLVCLSAACLPVYFAIVLMLADWRLERVRAALQSDDPRQAIEEYQSFSTAKPKGFYIDLWFSREMASAAAKATETTARQELWSAGRAAASRAAVHSETPQNAFYNLAFFASQEEDLATVERSLRAAAAAAPKWYQPYWMLAQVLAATGRQAEAIPLADLAVELSGGNNAEVNAVRQSLQAATQAPPSP